MACCSCILRDECCRRAGGRGSSGAATAAAWREGYEVQRAHDSAARRRYRIHAYHFRARIRPIEEVHHGIDERRSDFDRL